VHKYKTGLIFKIEHNGTKLTATLKKSRNKNIRLLQDLIIRYNIMLEPQPNFLTVNYNTIHEEIEDDVSTDSEDSIVGENDDQPHDQNEVQYLPHEEMAIGRQLLSFASVMEANRQTRNEMDNWQRMYWRYLEDLYHLQNDLENAVRFYNEENEMYGRFIETINSMITPDDVASAPKPILVQRISQCQVRIGILRNRCERILNQLRSQFSYTSRHRNRLVEIDHAFSNGLLAGQHWLD
jgi:hypothetical protein